MLTALREASKYDPDMSQVDSNRVQRAMIVIAIGAVLFVLVTKILPMVVAIAGNIFSIAISIGIVLLIGFILVQVLKWRFK